MAIPSCGNPRSEFHYGFRVRTSFYRFEVKLGTSTCVPIFQGRYFSPGTW
jgi:hypothetical protein